jgi:hypothetical protein
MTLKNLKIFELKENLKENRKHRKWKQNCNILMKTIFLIHIQIYIFYLIWQTWRRCNIMLQ